MVSEANHSRLSALEGPPHWLATAREREGQKKRVSVMPSSRCAAHCSGDC